MLLTLSNKVKVRLYEHNRLDHYNGKYAYFIKLEREDYRDRSTS